MQQVKFNLDNDPIDYVLTYDFNEIADAEALSGCNLLIAIANIWTMSATQMRAMLYACLKTAHPQVLLKEAGQLLTRDSGTVMTALAKVLGAEKAEVAPPAEAESEEAEAVAVGGEPA